MPVPSSFNDIGQDKSLRDFVGWVWYDTSFYVPPSWSNELNRILLRFSSVHYYALCYLNGAKVTDHVGGHLPFEVEVTKKIVFNQTNLLTVAVNNTLTLSTLPQATLEHQSSKVTVMKPLFDFFNYAGIHRSVHLSKVPFPFINDVTVIPSCIDDLGVFEYSIIFQSNDYQKNSIQCEIEIWDNLNLNKVATSQGCEGTVKIANVQLWWPYLMHPKPGYLYHIKAKLLDSDKLVDEYKLKSGVRTITLTNSSFLINNKPFYFLGFGKHEDSDVII